MPSHPDVAVGSHRDVVKMQSCSSDFIALNLIFALCGRDAEVIHSPDDRPQAPSGPTLSHAMSSPRVKTFQPCFATPAGGCSMEVVLPHALGNAGRDVSGFAVGTLDADDSAYARQPSLGLRRSSLAIPQRKHFCSAVVAPYPPHDQMVLSWGRMTNQPPLGIQIERAMDPWFEFIRRAQLDEARRRPSAHDYSCEHDVNAVR